MISLERFKKKKKVFFETVTEREKEVLALVASGMSNPAIAEKLIISRVTVQNHRASIRQKLGIKNDHDFLRYAFAFDLIEL